jgi:hypothetical protein
MLRRLFVAPARSWCNDAVSIPMYIQNHERISTTVDREVVYWRRIIAFPARRRPGLTLDRYEHEELDRILKTLALYFAARTPIEWSGLISLAAPCLTFPRLLE